MLFPWSLTLIDIDPPPPPGPDIDDLIEKVRTLITSPCNEHDFQQNAQILPPIIEEIIEILIECCKGDPEQCEKLGLQPCCNYWGVVDSFVRINNIGLSVYRVGVYYYNGASLGVVEAVSWSDCQLKRGMKVSVHTDANCDAAILYDWCKFINECCSSVPSLASSDPSGSSPSSSVPSSSLSSLSSTPDTCPCDFVAPVLRSIVRASTQKTMNGTEWWTTVLKEWELIKGADRLYTGATDPFIWGFRVAQCTWREYTARLSAWAQCDPGAADPGNALDWEGAVTLDLPAPFGMTTNMNPSSGQDCGGQQHCPDEFVRVMSGCQGPAGPTSEPQERMPWIVTDAADTRITGLVDRCYPMIRVDFDGIYQLDSIISPICSNLQPYACGWRNGATTCTLTNAMFPCMPAVPYRLANLEYHFGVSGELDSIYVNARWDESEVIVHTWQGRLVNPDVPLCDNPTDTTEYTVTINHYINFQLQGPCGDITVTASWLP